MENDVTGKSRMWSIRKNNRSMVRTLCIHVLTNYISIKIKAYTKVSSTPYNVLFLINHTQLTSKLSLYIKDIESNTLLHNHLP